MQTTLQNGMTYTSPESFRDRHPSGGFLTMRKLTEVMYEVSDTRKFNGKRRSVRGVVVQCGSDGWQVTHNPGENYSDKGRHKTETPTAAWELSLS